MITSINILTKVGKGHKETHVNINWSGISESDLRILAQRYIISSLQADMIKHQRCPEEVSIDAADLIQHEVISTTVYKIPDSWKGGTVQSSADVFQIGTLEAFLKTLTPEEQLALLS